ncbi:flagellum-specific ATP synthase [Monaibacterium marinum]|uniref:Flagellum-specific ATP synthase n=1 Tax=Pontivivens marinum TaxID=1690039 RepID=A0A2C9CXC9_9RHOB|nr:flagellum-specific ATP synthase FliI [Monaibacterium marinum]SOH95089.1 flagellum-specific ATP synthase [Monaibacterium marinum]
MTQFAAMTRSIREIPQKSHLTTLRRIEEGLLVAHGLRQDIGVGDVFSIEGGTRAEVTSLSQDEIKLAPFGAINRLAPGAYIWKDSSNSIRPDTSWLGRVVNAFGDPMDGQALSAGPLRLVPTGHRNALSRRSLGTRLDTGQPAIDTMLPLVKGQRIGLFAGSGVGKTSLLNALASGIKADVIVFAMIGERGHELASFINHTMDAETRSRCICVAATADCSALERRRAAQASIDIAEHFKEQGKHVLILMDSLTRWAEAHRQVQASQAGTTITTGFPANTGQDLARMMERLGPGSAGQGDITAVLSVLVAGSDMDEPLADMVRGMLDGHIILDREIAESGRFPAIDVLKSVSRSLPQAANADENAVIMQVRKILAAASRIAPLRDAGLAVEGENAQTDSVMKAADAIDTMWSARDLPDATTSFARLSSLCSAARF